MYLLKYFSYSKGIVLSEVCKEQRGEPTFGETNIRAQDTSLQP